MVHWAGRGPEKIEGIQAAGRLCRPDEAFVAATPLTVIVVVFGAALVAAWMMRALRAPTVLGFLLAGVTLGPSGLGLISADYGRDQVQFFAELGLVVLLFTVGLEMGPGPLLRTGPRLLAATLVQMALTGLATGLAVRYLLDLEWTGAWLAGLAVSLSSTAIVLKHLSDRDQIDTPAGAVITGILLLQDMAVILALILLPLLGVASGPPGHWTLYLLKIGLALGGLIAVSLIARLVMPGVVSLVFRFGGQELMTLFAIVTACVGAWLASLADWSWPLGAFIAGLLLAQSDLAHQLRAEITPFRDTFNALFFVSIGMLTDLEVFARYPLALTLAVGATVLLKAGLAFAAIRLAGWPLRLALTAGVGLSTISEFGYVLTKEAARFQMITGDFVSVFVIWTVGTMLVGALLLPAAAPVGAAVSRWLETLGQPPARESIALAAQPTEAVSHVIIVGYGVNGRNLARVLLATRIPFIVVEFNRANARLAREDRAEVIVGDAARMSILLRAGLATARALVVSIADRDATRRIVAQAHRARPDLYILARTRYVADLQTLYRLGARQVIPEEFETSIEIFAHVLREFAVPNNVIEQQVTLVRAGQYSMLRGRPTDRDLRTEWLQVLQAAVTQTFMLTADSPACGQTIGQTRLRSRTGVTIVAITRRGTPIANPSPDFRLEEGDVLVLVGTHRQLDHAKAVLGPPAVAEDHDSGPQPAP